MTTRYVLRKLPTQLELSQTHKDWQVYWQNIQLPRPRFNIGPHPHKTAPLITNHNYQEMLFGMKPQWADSILVNAKVEGIKKSKFWKPLIAMRPCLIPADGFYVTKELNAESKTGTQRDWFGIEFTDHQAFFIAGLWKPIKDKPDDPKHRTMRFVLLTRESHSCVKALCHRMPIIFTHHDLERSKIWMNTQLDIDTRIRSLINECEYPNLQSFQVSQRIKNLGNDDSDLFRPI